MRRRRPLLRAAVVGGGAYVAGRNAGRRQGAAAQEADQDAQTSQPEQQPAVPSQRAADSPLMDQLNQLTAMHEQGALTDEEFSAAKSRLLGG